MHAEIQLTSPGELRSSPSSHPVRVLAVHSKYAQRGGEDEVYEAERDLLRSHGHVVTEYLQDNSDIAFQHALHVGIRTIWSQQDYRKIRAAIRTTRSELVAVHNIFPLISPAVYYAARAEGVPVVQTLHNYRLICPSATLLRDGQLCEQCVGLSIPWHSIQHACYRDNRILTSAVAGMISVHRLLGTWDHLVTRYIALTDYMKDRYVAGGFAADKILVKPNFTPDTEPGTGQGNFFVFAGRLSVEKGVSMLLRAWQLAGLACELHILGSGPEEMNLKAQASRMPNVRFLGEQSRARVQEEMGNAVAVIVPSIWPEPFGLSVIESFAKGTPVLATDIGGISSLIRPGDGGFLFSRDDVSGLAALLTDQTRLLGMRQTARKEYELRFTAKENYSLLESIYGEALEAQRRTSAAR